MNEYVPPQCEHIRDNGMRCGSPAMRGRDFCYYHRRLHSNVLPGDSDYVLPALETEQSIQLAATHIVRAMLKGKIDRRDAMVMLAGIRLAQGSIRRSSEPSEHEIDCMEWEMTPAMERVCGGSTERMMEGAGEGTCSHTASADTCSQTAGGGSVAEGTCSHTVGGATVHTENDTAAFSGNSRQRRSARRRLAKMFCNAVAGATSVQSRAAGTA